MKQRREKEKILVKNSDYFLPDYLIPVSSEDYDDNLTSVEETECWSEGAVGQLDWSQAPSRGALAPSTGCETEISSPPLDMVKSIFS